MYTFTVRVTDDGSPNLSDEQEVELTVEEVNRAPVLDAIDDATIDEMGEYTFDADATDPDIPANTLTYSLIDGPLGATIDSATGEFSWTRPRPRARACTPSRCASPMTAARTCPTSRRSS